MQIILAVILITLAASFSYVEVEDMNLTRKAAIWGKVKLIHYHIDNKLALVIEDAVNSILFRNCIIIMEKKN
jgi:hypothetical protein